jgi:hypothetical protein
MKAFPQTVSNEYQVEHGMDLRDYFACHAMQAIIANNDLLKEASVYHNTYSEDSIARLSYEQADAMMEVRKK